MPRVIRLLISLAILGLIARQFGAGVLEQLQAVEPGWLLAALALTVAQIILSAWRWRFTAARLQIPLPPGRAVGEYYLATLVNQVLPGGVVGDAQRAWRHSQGMTRRGPAFQAVVIERLSGQLAMVTIAIAVWVGWPPGASLKLPVGSGGAALTALAAAGAVVAIALLAPRGRAGFRDWGQALHSALLAPRVLPVQLAASFAVAASYIAVYAGCILALSPAAPASSWLPLIPLVLFTMLIPASIAGWGLREGAAALLWPLAGLPAAEGVTAAVLYGALSLLASTPGLVMLVRR